MNIGNKYKTDFKTCSTAWLSSSSSGDSSVSDPYSNEVWKIVENETHCPPTKDIG